MARVLKLKAALAAIGLCWGAQSTALAQNTANSSFQISEMKDAFNASDYAEMLNALSIEATIAPYEDNDAATLLAETPGGGRFLISLFSCADPAAGLRCQGAATYTAFSNAGLAYDDINTFNSLANVAKAVNVAEQNVVIFGVQRFFNGGVTKENLLYGTQLFLLDMQNYISAQDATSTSVSLQLGATENSTGKSENLTGRTESSSSVTGVVGVFSPTHAVGAAIANTKNASFEVKQAD
ncbi:MAG: hypothetical protein AAGD92_14730 [Pseudomonadota bacterium]